MSQSDSALSNLVTAADAPSGCIPLVEPYDAHLEFLRNCPEDTIVLVRLSDIESFVRRGQTASGLFPEGVTVITTTTVSDEYLGELGCRREAELVREFDPAYHIPGDVPVYRETDRTKRRRRIGDYLDRTVAVARELAGEDVRIIPLLKGVCVEEWRIVRRVFDALGVEYYAFYGTQYFLSGAGFGDLLEDLRGIVSAMPDRDQFLIGLLAPQMLKQLPPQIVAASGLHQWRTWVDLRDVPATVSRSKYPSLERAVESVLGEGQVPLGVWADASREVA